MIDALSKLKEINGKKVIIMDELRDKFPEKFNESGSMDYKWFEQDIRPHNHIYVRLDAGSISFSMLTKPVSEGGNPDKCQPTDLIAASLEIIKSFNAKFPCRENAITITKLEEALMWQNKRTQDRTNRGVEGTSQR